MSRISQTIWGAVVFGAMMSVVPAAPPPERSVSSSRQFIVFGSNVRLRGAICDLAERCKRDALRLLGQRDEWKTPIVIQARHSPISVPGEPVGQLNVNQTGAGLKFQLELRVAREVGVPEVERELLRVIILEMAYREQSDLPAGAAFEDPPDWLLEGILALSAEGGSAFLAHALSTATTGNVLTLEEFLRQRQVLLESPSQTLYRAYSAALISMLMDGLGGRVRLGRFVAGLARAQSDPLADLKTYFPELGENAENLEKTWRACVMRLSGNEPYRVAELRTN